MAAADIPVVTDKEEVVRQPWVAVLSGLVHHDHERRDELFRALLDGFSGLDRDQVEAYTDILFAGLPEPALQDLEKLMYITNYKFKSDFALRNQALGKAEGVAEGLTKGEANAIIKVLIARGLKVPARHRDRITQCSDSAQLDNWLTKAVSAERTDDIFG